MLRVRSWRAIGADRRGALAVHAAIMITMMIALVGFGVEISSLLLEHRKLQAAADEVGMAVSDPYFSDAEQTANATAVAGSYGYQNGVDGVTLSLLSPASSSSGYSADPAATEVVLTKTIAPTFSVILHPSNYVLGARAVSKPVGLSTGCLLALDPTSTQSVLLRNGAQINNVSCELDVNSSNSAALALLNNAIINGPVNIVGNYSKVSSAQLLGSPITVGGPATQDPYTSVVIPTAPSCTSQSGTMTGVGPHTRNAGNFCSGLAIGNNAQVTLNPGIYYVASNFTIGQNAVVTATGGVTIILTSANAVTFSNNAAISLTAPTSGAMAGIAFMSTSTADTAITVANGTSLNVTGAMYFPNSKFTVTGNAITNSAPCTQVVAKKIDIGSVLQFKADCTGVAVRPIGRSGPRVVQ